MVRDPETEARKMEEMGAWLDHVCAEFDIDPAIVDAVRDPMLDLIAAVAHGPSRPGAPMTAMLLGLVSTTDQPQELLARIARVKELVASYPGQQEQ